MESQDIKRKNIEFDHRHDTILNDFPLSKKIVLTVVILCSTEEFRAAKWNFYTLTFLCNIKHKSHINPFCTM